MVDLIERERREHQANLDELKKDKKRGLKRRILSGVGSVAFGVGLYHLSERMGQPIRTILSSAMGFLVYESFSARLKNYRNPLATAAPREIIKNFRRVVRSRRGKTTLGDLVRMREEYADAIESSGVVEREVNRAFLDMGRGSGPGGFLDAFDLACRRKKRQNLLERLSWRLVELMTDKMIERGDKISAADAMYSICECMRVGRVERAKQLLNHLIGASESHAERQDFLCMQAYLLESQGEHDLAKEVFATVLGDLVERGPQHFIKIDGTKNEVYVHDSEFLGSAFVFKTQKDKKRVELEDRRSSFFNEVGGERFVRPLGVIRKDGVPYGTTRRVGRFGLNDYIIEGHEEEARRILGESLEAILLLHLRSEKELGRARRFFESEHFGEALWHKFVEREKFYGATLDSVQKGVGALCGEIEGVWRAVAHGDFHPGNVRVDREGKIYIIDAEDGIITSPYVDPVTIVENHLFRDMLTEEDCLSALMSYSDNTVDSGVLFSRELSMRYLHLSGAFKHLLSFGSVAKFTGPDDFEVVRNHHIRKELAHLEALESFGISRIDDLRGLRTCLEGVYCNA